jgi:hypothetical protein
MQAHNGSSGVTADTWMPADDQERSLLDRINAGLSEEVNQRYYELIAKRQEGRLTPEEHKELLELAGQLERFTVQRLEALVALAQHRQVSLREPMESLESDGKRE